MWVLLSTPTPGPYEVLMANHIFGLPAGTHVLQDKSNRRKDSLKVSMPIPPVVVASHSITITLPIPYHSITKSISRCEGRHVGVAVNTDMSLKWQVGPLDFL